VLSTVKKQQKSRRVKPTRLFHFLHRLNAESAYACFVSLAFPGNAGASLNPWHPDRDHESTALARCRGTVTGFMMCECSAVTVA